MYSSKLDLSVGAHTQPISKRLYTEIYLRFIKSINFLCGITEKFKISDFFPAIYPYI